MGTSVAPPSSTPDADTERHAAALELASSSGWGDRERPSSPGHYLALEGADVRFVSLDRDVVRIGRSLIADVRLDDHLVSRRHAMLVRRASGHRLLDDRSANGTMVNGRRVEQVELSDGDVIVVGRSILRYVVVS
jgi:pSer/pThr/pTyr-binding forkhead associated (FHA) protein